MSYAPPIQRLVTELSKLPGIGNRTAQRLATLKPVALLGGAQAMREPWRALYAHLMAAMTWTELTLNFAELPLHGWLAAKPRATLDAMAARGDRIAAHPCGAPQLRTAPPS